MTPLAQPLARLEATLFAARQPLNLTELATRLPEINASDLPQLLDQLARDYDERGIRLVQRGKGWAFRTAPGLKLTVPQAPPRKLSRAVLETLTVIAYYQPVTRSEIEAVRGVAAGRGTLDQLIDANLIRAGRRRRTPGRPLTWITTETFLDRFSLTGLTDLPRLDELRDSGLLNTSPAILNLSQADETDETDGS